MTYEEVEDLVADWHLEYEGDLSLSEFVCERTGWSAEEYDHWARTGGMPNV